MDKIYKTLKVGFNVMGALLQILIYRTSNGLMVVSPAFQEILLFSEQVITLSINVFSIIDEIFES